MKCTDCEKELSKIQSHRRVCNECWGEKSLESVRPITSHRKNGCHRIKCNRGWFPIIVEAHEQLVKEDPEYQFLVAKEKFGTLSLYVWDKDGGWILPL